MARQPTMSAKSFRQRCRSAHSADARPSFHNKAGRMGVSAANVQLMLIGVLVSGIVGYLTIKYFLRFLAGHRLDVFAYYRWALAAVTLVWLLAR